jgi:type IV secretory pathway VirB6-like protein
MLDAGAVVASAIVPAVLISSSSLLLLSFSNRITSVMSRQRALSRELLREDNGEGEDWSRALQSQIADVRLESNLIRTAVALMLVSIVFLLACGLLLMVAHLSQGIAIMAVVVFVLGVLSYAGGTGVMVYDTTVMTHPDMLEGDLVKQIVRKRGSQRNLAEHKV